MLDMIASVAGDLLGGAGVGGTGSTGSGTDAAIPPASNSNQANADTKVVNRSRSGGAKLTISSTRTGGSGSTAGRSPLDELADSGIPVWLVVFAVVAIIGLVVLALVLGG